MGVFGIFIAMLLNIFLQSPLIHFGISVIGVIVFTGLTAYDTQKIKNLYYEGDSSETGGKKAIMGALTLYLDFILLFVMLLRLIGNQR
jgi:FtsH-binding integral membrane protein